MTKAEEPELAVDASLVAQDPSFYEPVEADAKQWLADRIAEEVTRLKASNVQALALPVKNMSIIVTEHDHAGSSLSSCKPTLLNRLEIRTNYNFHWIRQIMVSPAIPFPHKPGYHYVNLLLFSDKPLPLIVPYVYPTEIRLGAATTGKTESGGERLMNRLEEFQFVNERGEAVRHQIKEYRQH